MLSLVSSEYFNSLRLLSTNCFSALFLVVVSTKRISVHDYFSQSNITSKPFCNVKDAFMVVGPSLPGCGLSNHPYLELPQGDALQPSVSLGKLELPWGRGGLSGCLWVA